MNELTCRACGTAVTGASRFCPSCGGSLLMAQQSASAADPWIGKLVQGRFRVLEKLGAGGMGVVYKAEQVAMRRPVALKMLHPTLVQDAEVVTRFENEAAACSKLTHPNTITVHDFGQAEDGSLFIAMEFVSGSSLEQVLRQGALPWPRAVKIAQQICASLAEAHAHGIVHRDLKPGNIMLFERSGNPDTVKVLDFGIAKICEGSGGVDQRQALTRTGMVFGTPQYMSPEQIKGEKVGPRSDLYAVGVILYEMLTGELPFSAETPMGMLTKHLLEMPRPLRQALPGVDVPAALERTIMTAMAKGLDERQASMDVLARDLEACLAEASGVTAGGAARAPAPMAIAATRLAPSGAQAAAEPVAARRASRGPLLGVLGVAGLLVVGVLAWSLSRASSGDEPSPPGPAGPVPTAPTVPSPFVPPIGTGPAVGPPAVAPVTPVTPTATNVPTPVAPVAGACTLVGEQRAAAVVEVLRAASARLRACATTDALQLRYRITGRTPATDGLDTTPAAARGCVDAVVAGLSYPADAAGRVEVTLSVAGGTCSGRVQWTRVAATGHGGRGPGKKDEVLPGR